MEPPGFYLLKITLNGARLRRLCYGLKNLAGAVTSGREIAGVAKYLLDTTALIDHLNGRQPVVTLLTKLALQGHELGLCCINIAELYSGLDNDERIKADMLINGLDYYEISEDMAKVAGVYRFEFARKGITLTIADTLIAAVARGYGAILVTANVRDYPMEDIDLLLASGQ
ncbi:MAG: type II toxin-antitoxin system VapC family toxin [Chloroflexi bacterium]|nr:type II toxin-antitoxin system VapC family toxin [Chloroflexota bacterium]MBM4453314.1 type II toxin-antitoxin system VapC family toxin [Chloroflexota bacterium]